MAANRCSGWKYGDLDAATFWIRQAIQRGLANKARTIRIPVHIGHRHAPLRGAGRQLGLSSEGVRRELEALTTAA